MGNELDLELVDAARQSLPGRSSQDATQGHAQLLSARAVAENRPSTLDQGAIAHLQAVAGNGGVSRLLEDDAPEQVRSVLSRRGEPLEAAVAADMSARLGTDLSDVRIHRDAAASESARAVNANAYTVGSDIVFQSGQYDPSGPAGQRTLAHELTHVVQQRQGSVDGTDVGGGLALSDPADRFEREASVAAERLAASAAPVPTPSPVTAARTLDEDTTAQRVIDIETVADEEERPEEEEEGAGLIGQRQAEDEEEEEESVAG